MISSKQRKNRKNKEKWRDTQIGKTKLQTERQTNRHTYTIHITDIKKATKDKSNDEIKDGFVDWVRVQVKAGDGGNGGNTLLSVYANEFAGPDGGNGGNGGHFLFKATKKVNSLGYLKVKIKMHYIAD